MNQFYFCHSREPGFEGKMLYNKAEYKEYGRKNQLFYSKFFFFSAMFVAVTVLMSATAAAATVRMFMVVMAVFMFVTFAVVFIVLMMMVVLVSVSVFIVAVALFVLIMIMVMLVEFVTMLVVFMAMLMLMMMITYMHHFLLDALIDSFTISPVGQVFINPSIYSVATTFLGDYFVLAFRIVLPIFGSMLLVNTVLAILAKVAPQMSMFVIGIQLKVIVGLVVMLVVIELIPGISEIIFDKMLEVMRNAASYISSSG